MLSRRKGFLASVRLDMPTQESAEGMLEYGTIRDIWEDEGRWYVILEGINNVEALEQAVRSRGGRWEAATGGRRGEDFMPGNTGPRRTSKVREALNRAYFAMK